MKTLWNGDGDETEMEARRGGSVSGANQQVSDTAGLKSDEFEMQINPKIVFHFPQWQRGFLPLQLLPRPSPPTHSGFKAKTFIQKNE